MVTFTEALKHRCPRCCAGSDEYCITDLGLPAQTLHNERLREASRQQLLGKVYSEPTPTRKERQARERLFTKCPCGNTAGVGETLCGACRAREKVRLEARADTHDLNVWKMRLEHGANSPGELRDALIAVIAILLKRT